MKIYIALILAAALFSACSNKQPSESSNTQSNASTQSTPSKAENSQKTSESTSGAPIEFTCLGLSADKTGFSYRVKVNTDKPISQVDIEVKTVDEKGKSSTETYLWQNIVKSHQQPIEKGKTYESEETLAASAAKVECKMKRVVFADDTTWDPK